VSVRRVAFVSISAVVVSAGLVTALGAGAACTHDREEPPPPVDAPKPDQLPPAEVQLQEPSVLDPVKGVDQPANLSCLGMSQPDAGPIFPLEAGTDAGDDAGDDAEPADTMMPADGGVGLGALVEKQIELIGFGTGGADKLSNQTIDVYYSNTFKAAPSITVKSDEKGIFKALLPQGVRVGYHVKNSTLLGDYYALDDLHEPIPPATNIRWQGVTRERMDTLALAITGQKGYQIKPGTGIIAGRVMDCDRRYMQHARVEILDFTDNENGVPLTFGRCGAGLCRVYLSDAELPDIGRLATSRAGLFSMIDVPVGRKLRLVAFGLKDGAEKEIAWRNLEVKEFGIATHLVEPNASKALPTP